MPATVQQVAEKLAEVLRDNTTGISVDWFQPDQLNVPHAWLEIDTIDYHHDLARGRKIGWNLNIALHRSGARAAAEKIYEYLEGTTIVNILEDDPTLDGLISDVTVTEGAEAGQTYIGQTPYPTVTFTIETIL